MLNDSNMLCQDNSNLQEDFVVFDSQCPHLIFEGVKYSPSIKDELLNKKRFLLKSLEE